MSTIGQCLDWGRKKLGDSSDARSEAGVLLCHILRKPRSWLFAWPEKAVNEDDVGRYQELVGKRARGTPIAYLTGSRDFWSLRLAVDEHTLIPRPETEHLIEFVLERFPDDPPLRVIDLGTGSGAIALALASERPTWQIIASDRSQAALLRARANARAYKLPVGFVLSDWLRGTRGPFDLIISNPPYIAKDDPHLQQGDLRFEPVSALASGPDGLDDIRKIIDQARSRLVPGGQLLFEHGFDQGRTCRALLSQHGYQDIGSGQDLAGHERFSHAVKPHGTQVSAHTGKPC